MTVQQLLQGHNARALTGNRFRISPVPLQRGRVDRRFNTQRSQQGDLVIQQMPQNPVHTVTAGVGLDKRIGLGQACGLSVDHIELHR